MMSRIRSSRARAIAARSVEEMNEVTSKTELGSADIARVLHLLPHRYPFLLVDRIFDMDGDHSAVGLKNVTINEPFFQGHFPGFPVMPGVLIIEGLAQTAGALCIHNLGETYKPQLVYFMCIDRALAEGCERVSHVAVAGRTSIGPRTRIFPFASIGHQPQDLKYQGEPSTLTVGADCLIREGVTMNPGTAGGGMTTIVGDRCA